jgi:hypothetical protein
MEMEKSRIGIREPAQPAGACFASNHFRATGRVSERAATGEMMAGGCRREENKRKEEEKRLKP